MLSIEDRAARYIAKIQSIEGQNGDTACFAAACALVEGFNLPTSKALDLMRQWNQTCASPAWQDHRLVYKINEAAKVAEKSARRGYLLNGQEACTTKYIPVMPALELPEEITSIRQFLTTAFKPGENISISRGRFDERDNRTVMGSGTVLTLEKWLEISDAENDSLARWFGGTSNKDALGAFIRCNPMLPDGEKDVDVTAHRHVVIEFDHLTLKEQWAKIKASNAPITAVIYSGSKSLHAWVRVDAKDRQEYNTRAAELLTIFGGADTPVARNPNRFSRLPGVWREGKRQQLLALNIGAPSWDAWEKPAPESQPAQVAVDECEEDTSLPQLVRRDVTQDPNNLLGERWICKKGSCLLVGPSGVGKSSFNMQAALTWALGRPLFGILSTRPLKSLIIQAENDVGDLAEEVQGVQRGLGLSIAEMDALSSMIQIKRQASKIGVEFTNWLRKQIEEAKPDLCWLDPLLSYLGGDINSQKECAHFLRTLLTPIADSTGVAWMIIHHTGKPVKDNKGNHGFANVDPDYAGMGSSELTNWARAVLMIRPHKNAFKLIAKKRGKRAGLVDQDGVVIDPVAGLPIKHSDTGILWEYGESDTQFVPVMPKEKKDNDAKESSINNLTKFKSKFSLIDFQIEFLKNNGSQKATCEALKISKTTFFRLKKELDDAKSKTTSDGEEFK